MDNVSKIQVPREGMLQKLKDDPIADLVLRQPLAGPGFMVRFWARLRRR